MEPQAPGEGRSRVLREGLSGILGVQKGPKGSVGVLSAILVGSQKGAEQAPGHSGSWPV